MQAWQNQMHLPSSVKGFCLIRTAATCWATLYVPKRLTLTTYWTCLKPLRKLLGPYPSIVGGAPKIPWQMIVPAKIPNRSTANASAWETWFYVPRLCVSPYVEGKEPQVVTIPLARHRPSQAQRHDRLQDPGTAWRRTPGLHQRPRNTQVSFFPEKRDIF